MRVIRWQKQAGWPRREVRERETSDDRGEGWRMDRGEGRGIKSRRERNIDKDGERMGTGLEG